MENAYRFMQEAAAHQDWLEKIRESEPEGIIAFAREQGYPCEFADLRSVSLEVLKGAPDEEVSLSEIEEAKSASVGGDENGGYGADSGFALISEVAAEILKKEKKAS